MTTTAAIIILLAAGYISGRGTIRCACITSWKPCNKLKGGWRSHFKDETNWDSERLSSWPKIAQLISNRTGFWTQIRANCLGQEINLVINCTLTSNVSLRISTLLKSRFKKKILFFADTKFSNSLFFQSWILFFIESWHRIPEIC